MVGLRIVLWGITLTPLMAVAAAAYEPPLVVNRQAMRSILKAYQHAQEAARERRIQLPDESDDDEKPEDEKKYAADGYRFSLVYRALWDKEQRDVRIYVQPWITRDLTNIVLQYLGISPVCNEFAVASVPIDAVASMTNDDVVICRTDEKELENQVRCYDISTASWIDRYDTVQLHAALRLYQKLFRLEELHDEEYAQAVVHSSTEHDGRDVVAIKSTKYGESFQGVITWSLEIDLERARITGPWRVFACGAYLTSSAWHSPNLLYVGSADGRVRLFDVETGFHVGTLFHTAPVLSLATGSDPRMLYVGMSNGTLAVWNKLPAKWIAGATQLEGSDAQRGLERIAEYPIPSVERMDRRGVERRYRFRRPDFCRRCCCVLV